MIIQISQYNSNQRLDSFLARKLPQYSRAFLKQQIKLGNILVNGKIKKPSYILKSADKVEANITAPAKSILQSNPNIKLKIIYEDENIIAIDKPAGILTHPTAIHKENNTIANAFLAYYPKIKNVGDEPDLRPGIVHRLDKDTSGIMVVAKNQKSFEWLKKQFQERKITKKYLALVMGNIKENKGIITKPIGKTKDFRKRTTIPLKKQKEAVTYYKVIKYFPIGHPELDSGSLLEMPKRKAPAFLLRRGVRHDNNTKDYTLLEAEPKTGRTHQIRVHFASIGHPIAGDHLYGFKNQVSPKGLKRHFLHASYLKLSLLDGRIIELKSELPEDLKTTLDNLEGKF